MPSSSLHYDIIEEIGRGATSIVYRAHDPRLDRDVALKVSRTDFFEPDLDDFVREARVLAKLQHRFIVPVYEAGLFDGKPAIAMQLVEGRTLDHVLGEGSIDLADAIKYGEQLLEALSFAHERGVIHRDVKPSNIFITDSGDLLLSDFGLARSLGSATITATGSVLGSPGYFAPEQVRGEASTPASDVFSAGVVLFQMLTGRNPYLEETGGELPAIAYKITHDNLPSVSKFAPNTPRNIARVVRRATQRAQAARFPGAEEMLTAWRSGMRTSELLRSLLLNAWFDRKVRTAITVAGTVFLVALVMVLSGPTGLEWWSTTQIREEQARVADAVSEEMLECQIDVIVGLGRILETWSSSGFQSTSGWSTVGGDGRGAADVRATLRRVQSKLDSLNVPSYSSRGTAASLEASKHSSETALQLTEALIGDNLVSGSPRVIAAEAVLAAEESLRLQVRSNPRIGARLERFLDSGWPAWAPVVVPTWQPEDWPEPEMVTSDSEIYVTWEGRSTALLIERRHIHDKKVSNEIMYTRSTWKGLSLVFPPYGEMPPEGGALSEPAFAIVGVSDSSYLEVQVFSLPEDVDSARFIAGLSVIQKGSRENYSPSGILSWAFTLRPED